MGMQNSKDCPCRDGDSHSMSRLGPPTLATRLAAEPDPVLLSFSRMDIETYYATRFFRTARSVVLDAELERQRDPLLCCRAATALTPGRKAGLELISLTRRPPFSPIASAAFFTSLRKTWTSWSRLPSPAAVDGSYSSTNLMWRGEA